MWNEGFPAERTIASRNQRILHWSFGKSANSSKRPAKTEIQSEPWDVAQHRVDDSRCKEEPKETWFQKRLPPLCRSRRADPTNHEPDSSDWEQQHHQSVEPPCCS